PQELSQPSSRVRLALEVLDDSIGPLALPSVQGRLDQGIAVGEVPVEAALRRAEFGGDRLHGNSINTAPRDRGYGCPCPVAWRERPLACLAHEHTVAYGRDIRHVRSRPTMKTADGGPRMRLPDSAHPNHPWRIHELTGDFRLEDVW